MGSLARLATEGAGLAMVLLSLQRTGSATTGGILLACSTFPQLVTGPLAGAALDASQRPGLLLAGAVGVSAMAVAGLAADRALGPVAVLLALALSIAMPVLTGGLSAGFARLAATSGQAAHIASWDAVAYNVAGLAGPALVTVVTAWAGAATATATLAVGIALALPAMAGSWTGPASEVGHTSRVALVGAARLIAARGPLRAVTVTTTVAFIGIGGLSIAAAAAARAAGRNGTDAGQLVTAVALGALVGSLWWTRLRPPIAPARTVVVATAITGLLLVAMAVGSWPVVLVGAVAVGVLDAPVLIGTFAARHAGSPLALRSSVFTIGASLKLAASSVGAVVAGWSLGTAASATGLAVIGGAHLVAAVLGWSALGAPRTMASAA